MASIPVVYVPPGPVEELTNAQVEVYVDPFFDRAKKVKKNLAYVIGAATVVILWKQKLAIVKWDPTTARFACMGASNLLPRNSNNFTRRSIGTFNASFTNTDVRTMGHLKEPEYDINNWMITTDGVSDMTKKVTGYSEIFMQDANSALIEKPYLLLVEGPFKWTWTTWHSDDYVFPQFEQDIINMLSILSVAMRDAIGGGYEWPDSNIHFRKEWLKMFYGSLYGISQLPDDLAFRNNGGPIAATLYTEVTLFGINRFCLYGDLLYWDSGGTRFYTVAYSDIWDEYAKFAKKDPTSGINVTWPAGIYKIGDPVDLVIPDIGTFTATFRDIDGTASGITKFWIESTNDAAGSFRFWEFYGIDMVGFYDAIEDEYHVEVTYGYFTYRNGLYFQDTFVHYDALGYEHVTGVITTESGIADVADGLFPKPAAGGTPRRMQFGFYDGVLVQGQSFEADIFRWDNGINRNKGAETLLRGAIYNYAVLTKTGLQYFAGDPGSTVQYTHDDKHNSTFDGTETLTDVRVIIRTYSITTHIHGHVFSWSGIQTCTTNRTPPNELSNEVCVPTISWGLGASSNDDRDAYLQYTMDGRSVVSFTSSNGATTKETVYINSIIKNDLGMGTYDTPGGTSMGTRLRSSDAGDKADDWTPYNGNWFAESEEYLNLHTPEGSVFPDSTSIDLVTEQGALNAMSQEAAKDNVLYRKTTGGNPQVSDTQFHVGLQELKGIGGVSTTGTGTVPVDIYLVDMNFKKIGRFSIDDDNSLWSVLATYMADQSPLNSNADTYDDPDLTAWLNAGNAFEDFVPELDENEDYVHEPNGAYQTLVDGILAKRAAVDAILTTQVTHNDFMSYELLSFWANYVGTNRPLASYILHSNAQQFDSVAF